MVTLYQHKDYRDCGPLVKKKRKLPIAACARGKFHFLLYFVQVKGGANLLLNPLMRIIVIKDL